RVVIAYRGDRLSNNQTGVVLLNSPRRALTFAAHLRAGVPCPAGGACLSERNGDYYKTHGDGSNGRLCSAASYIETAAGAPGSGAAFDSIRFGRGDPAP